jgi:small subunit ribosomal protein S8
MAIHDTIGDFLTVVRNASNARKASCSCRHSKLREGIARILKDEGFIADFAVDEEKPGRKFIHITLKYVNGVPALTGIDRWSRPGCRMYAAHTELPRVLGGLGLSILTTSKGIVKDREARRLKVGGELLCKVW